MPSLATSFDPTHNSLNFVRLTLAAAVIFSHAIPLGGFGNEHFLGRLSLGDLSVDAFFGLSGFLIMRSALRNSLPRFVWQRFLRIYPGYWACLGVVAFVIVPIAWPHDHPSLSSLLQAHVSPLHYALANAPLLGHWGISTIGDSPKGIPLPGSWNGPLWTLPFEVECYMVFATFMAVGVLRRRAVITTIILAGVLTSATLALSALSLNFESHDLNRLRLLPVFAVGGLFALWPERVPDSKWVALGALALVVLGVHLPVPHMVVGPAVTYIALWLAIHLPFSGFAHATDISYGLYIYGWPVQILLAIYGVHRYGYGTYVTCTFALAVPIAIASWFAIERPALSLKKWSPLQGPQSNASAILSNDGQRPGGAGARLE